MLQLFTCLQLVCITRFNLYVNANSPHKDDINLLPYEPINMIFKYFNTTLPLPGKDNVVDLPMSIPGRLDDIQIILDNIRCSNVELDSINIETVPTPKTQTPQSVLPLSLAISATGFKTDCFASDLKYNLIGWDGSAVSNGIGTAQTFIGKGSSFQSTISINDPFVSFGTKSEATNENSMITYLMLSKCYADMDVVDVFLDFTDGTFSNLPEPAMLIVEAIMVDRYPSIFTEDFCTVDLPSMLSAMTNVVSGINEEMFQPYSNQASSQYRTKIDEKLNFVDLTRYDEMTNFIAKALDNFDNVNNLIRTLILNEEGTLNILALDQIVDEFEINNVYIKDFLDHVFIPKSLTLRGIDTLSIDLPKLGPQAINERLKLSSLHLSIQGETIFDDYSGLSIEIADIEIASSILLAINQDSMANFTLGRFFHMNEMLPCLLSSGLLHLLNLVELDVQFSSINLEQAYGFGTSEMDKLVRDALASFVEIYMNSATIAIAGFFKDIFYLDSLDFNGTCPLPKYHDMADSVVDFSQLFSPSRCTTDDNNESIYGFVMCSVKKNFDEEFLVKTVTNETLLINTELIAPMTRALSGTAGTITMTEQEIETLLGWLNLVKLGDNITSDIPFTIQLLDVKIENIDSIGSPVNFMSTDISEPFKLRNGLKVGSSGKPLRITLNLNVDLEGTRSVATNYVRVVLELEDFQALVDIAAQISFPALFSYPISDIFSPYCWLATVKPIETRHTADLNSTDFADTSGLSLELIVLAFEKMRLEVDCVSCFSDELKNIAQILSSPQGIEFSSLLAKTSLTYATTFLTGDSFQQFVDQLLYESKYKCPHHKLFGFKFAAVALSSEVAVDTLDFLSIQLILLVVAVLSLVVVFIMLVRQRRKKYSDWIKSLSESDASGVEYEKCRYKQRCDDLNERTKSLALENDVPNWLRVLSLTLITSSTALYLYGHILKPMISVSLEIRVVGSEALSQTLTDLTIVDIVKLLWNFNEKLSALALAFLSLTFPYIRQVVAVFIWFIDPSYVGIKGRHDLIKVIHDFGKYSMIESFFVAIVIVVYDISISNDDTYTADILIQPGWSFFASFAANILVQANSHIIFLYHSNFLESTRKLQGVKYYNDEKNTSRQASNDSDLHINQRLQLSREDISYEENDEISRISSADTFQIPIDESTNKHAWQTMRIIWKKQLQVNESISLRKYTFFLEGGRNHGHERTFGSHVSIILIVLSVIISVFLQMICFIPLFSAKISGLISLAGGNESAIKYSLSNLCMATLALTTGSDIGIALISGILIISCSVVPAIHVLLLVWLWFAKTCPKRRRQLVTYSKMVCAWDFTGVICLTICALSVKLGVITSIINQFCAPLENSFTFLTRNGFVESDYSQCAAMHTEIKFGLYVLLCSSSILSGLSFFITLASSEVRKDHDIRKSRCASHVSSNPHITVIHPPKFSGLCILSESRPH